MVSIPLFSLLLFLFFPFTALSTILSDAAAAMNAGDWRSLTTTNIQATLEETCCGGASGGRTGYADHAEWDPATEQFLFVGSDHYHNTGYAVFMAYSASNNTWRVMTRPSWATAITASANHGYDHGAIDVATGSLFHRPFGSTTIRKYNIAAGTWSALPSYGQIYSVALGVEFFPEVKRLIVADVQLGKVHVFNPANNQWSSLPGTVANSSAGLHGTSLYNPVHKIIAFGGGNNNRSFYKLDTNLVYTRLADAPSGYSSSGLSGLLTVDPVSGDFLLFTGGGSFYSYKLSTNTWKQETGSDFFEPILGGSSGSSSVWEVIAVPIPALGVVMFAKSNRSNSNVYLYKHAEGTGEEANAKVGVKESMSVTPNPVTGGRAVLGSTSDGNRAYRRAAVYDARGNHVSAITDGVINTIGWAAGVYIVQAGTPAGQFSKKFLVTR